MEQENFREEEEREKRLKRQSLSGEAGRRGERRIRMKYKDYIRTLKLLSCTTALATTLVIGGGNVLYKQMRETSIINTLTGEFHHDCLGKETHRTQDNQHYYYDYDDIARYIEGMDNFDLGLYLFNHQTNDKQTSRVLEYTEYGTLDNYLREKHYKDSDEFRKEMKQVALLTKEIEERQIELSQLEEKEENIGGISK